MGDRRRNHHGYPHRLIFGLYTIVRSSSVRPAVLLRDMPVRRSWGTRFAGAALLLVLLAVFAVIDILIMGKVIDELGVMAGALAGLVVLTLLFGGALLGGLSIPTPGLPLLTLARRNLKRKPIRAVFALIALFAGVFAIGLAAGVILDARDRLASRTSPAEGYNLTIYGKQSDMQAIGTELQTQRVQDIHTSVLVPVHVTGASGQPISSLSYLDRRVPTSGNMGHHTGGRRPCGKSGRRSGSHWSADRARQPQDRRCLERRHCEWRQENLTHQRFLQPAKLQ